MLDLMIAKFFVKLKHIGLANIMFDFMGKDELHIELIQEQVTSENLLKAYKNCDRQKFLNSCLELRSYLKHGSARNIANMIKGKI